MFKCKSCEKTFTTTSSCNRHVREIHHDDSRDKKQHTSRIRCSLCEEDVRFRSFDSLNDHLEKEHQIKLERIQKLFANQEAFNEWKEIEEKNTNAFYTKHSQATSTVGTMVYYECHRSNLQKFKSNCSRRAPKMSGSIKLLGVCPSRMKVEFSANYSEVHVEYIKTHVGHTSELKCQPLTNDEKQAIVKKIEAGVSYKRIVEDARKVSGPQISRLNLLTKRDVSYIASSNKLDGKRHKSDIFAVDLKIQEWNTERENVFLYKKQGQEKFNLPSQDFLFAFMNEEMEFMLKSYGKNVICMDGTHGTNPYKYELTTILTLDDKNMGYPVAFFISNRKDKIAQEIFLQSLRNKIGPIQPKYFMSDDTTIYHDAWKNIMGEIGSKLLCTWHIKKNWNLQIQKKIKNKGIIKSIKNIMNTMLKETQEIDFLQKKNELFSFLQQNNERDIITYLETYYFQSPERIKSWAHCYRLHAGINTNMHLEAFHKNLKYNYFNGKTVNRLENCLEALDNFLFDKSWQRIGAILRPTVTKRDLLINKAHAAAEKMSLNMVAKVDPVTYLVHSESEINFYEVTLVNNNCNCSLKCVRCNSCIHNFSCTCYEYAVKNNMCKHVHLVVRYCGEEASGKSDIPPTESLSAELNIHIQSMQKRNHNEDSITPDPTRCDCEDLFKEAIQLAEENNNFKELSELLKTFNAKCREQKLPPPKKKQKIEKQTYFGQ